MTDVIYFTDRGKELSAQITGDVRYIDGRNGGVEEALSLAFSHRTPVVFIGACGIAVRLIAPYIRDKTTDPAVVCMDDAGRYAISLLSGHLGGANDLAVQISSQTGAIPVITTSTDVNHTFAIDVFAEKNGFGILNPSAIKTVSSRILSGESVPTKTFSQTFLLREDVRDYLRAADEDERPMINIVDSGWLFSMLNIAGIDPFMPLPAREVREDRLLDCGVNKRCLYLYEKDLCLGIGCRKGVPVDEILAFVKDVMMNRGLCMARIGSVSSIDIKKEETGITDFCAITGVPFFTYSADELNEAEGDFSSSAFVAGQVGVDNVCERAASLTAGASGEKILGKMKTARVTVSIYRKRIL